MKTDITYQGLMKFRRRPTRVEAMHFLSSNSQEVSEWCSGSISMNVDGIYILTFSTNDGTREAHFGDWIIKEPNGAFRAIPDVEFYVNYEEVDQ